MASHDYNIADALAAAVRTDLNALFAAIRSNNKSTGTPTDGLVAGQIWVDDINDPKWALNLYDGAQNIPLGILNTTSNEFELSATTFADATGLEALKLTYNASAVNHVAIANASTGSSPSVSAIGDDANISLSLNAKGSGNLIGNAPLTIGANAFTCGVATVNEVVGDIGSAPDPSFTFAGYNTTGIYSQTGGLAVKTTIAGAQRFAVSNTGITSVDDITSGDDVLVGDDLVISTGQASINDLVGSGFFGWGCSAPVVSQTSVEGVYYPNNGIFQVARNSANCATFNRFGTDGQIVVFQGQGVSEGNISVSGSTVSYNGFLGTHWGRLLDGDDADLQPGTILASTGEEMDWYQIVYTDRHGNEVRETVASPEAAPETVKEIWDQPEPKETYKARKAVISDEIAAETTRLKLIPKKQRDYRAVNALQDKLQAEKRIVTRMSRVSDCTVVRETDIKHVKVKLATGDEPAAVVGVYVSEDADDTAGDLYYGAVGLYVVRMEAGEAPKVGDLLTVSQTPGQGKVQDDDLVRSSTVGKVVGTSADFTYPDGSFTVRATVMAG